MDSDNRINRIVLALYLSFILISQIIADPNLCDSYLVIGVIAVTVFSFTVSRYIIRFVSGLSFKDKPHFDKLTPVKLKILFYGLPLFIMLLYYFAYYPGGFINDSLSQFYQYFYGEYSDWHPAFHTLFAFTLPLKLTGGWIGSIVLFQVLIMAAAVGYTLETIHEYAGKVYAIGCMIYILCNPLLAICVNPWKDTSFAIGTMLLMAFSLRIFITQGAWLVKPVNSVLFVVCMVFTTLFRHNAILFTIPLLVALLFCIPPKRFICLLMACICLFAVVKGPLYSAAEVERRTGRRQTETMGLPLNVIGAAVANTPELLDQDILDFAYGIAPPEIWEEYYEPGNLNIIKWGTQDDMDEYVDMDYADGYEASEIIDMMFRAFKASPYVCSRSLVKLTEGIYTVTDDHYVLIEPYIDWNYFGIGVPGIGIDNYIGLNKPATYSNMLTSFFYGTRLLVRQFCPHIFLYYGVAILAVIVSICSKLSLRRLKDWKVILFALPLLAYDFGTSLLLTGSNDSPRYFYCTVLIVPVLLIFFYINDSSMRCGTMAEEKKNKKSGGRNGC